MVEKGCRNTAAAQYIPCTELQAVYNNLSMQQATKQTCPLSSRQHQFQMPSVASHCQEKDRRVSPHTLGKLKKQSLK